MRSGGGGDGLPAWDGRIDVTPGNLEASAPSIAAGGNEVSDAQATLLPWQQASSVGITDPAAGAAWARMATIWSGDLGDLAGQIQAVAGKLFSAGAAYTATDGSAVP